MNRDYWPSEEDFDAAIRNLGPCFSDKDFREGNVRADQSGAPVVISGSSARVYRVDCANQQWAVRVFKHAVTDHLRRYSVAAAHLARVWQPWFAYFAYLSEGIQVDGVWYPVIKMEWVEGIDLATWTKQNLENTNDLRIMASQWRGMVASMRGAGVAHGNLEHTNVIVTPERQLRLIDYDGVYVPVFDGERAIELGDPNWNHPKRSEDGFNPQMDQFSGLVGYLTLLTAAEEPALVRKFGDDGKILFSAEDFKHPRRSKVLSALARSKGAGLKELAASMIKWCSANPDSMTLEKAANGCPIAIPDMRRVTMFKPLMVKVPRGPIYPEPVGETPTDPGEDTTPSPNHKPGRRLTKRTKRIVTVGSLALATILLAFTVKVLLSSPHRVCFEQQFDRQPRRGASFDRFRIFDKVGKTIIDQSKDDLTVCLEPGQYGFCLFDENGKVIEKRLTGFTVDSTGQECPCREAN